MLQPSSAFGTPAPEVRSSTASQAARKIEGVDDHRIGPAAVESTDVLGEESQYTQKSPVETGLVRTDAK